MLNKNAMFKRAQYETLRTRLQEKRRFIQVLAGPRQTGKTTLIRQVAESLSFPVHITTADSPTLRSTEWIEQQWDFARLQARKSERAGSVLVLDEIQKIPGWSEEVKRQWDKDSADKVSLKVVLLGSSQLLVQRGLSESLAGRFELIPITHWSFAEMQKAFGWSLEQYIFYGGYPGSAELIDELHRWKRYILDSLVETTIARDILLMTRVDKPALLRQLFHLGCRYSGQVLSYQKMLGQLQDAGNTTTLAHYLELLSSAGMITGLQKVASSQSVRQRASSPKLQVLNTALLSAGSQLTLDETLRQRDGWGRFVESAVGAHIVNSAVGTSFDVLYWRDGNREVDFIIRDGRRLVALEVKSGKKKENLSGLETFSKLFKPHRKLLVGGEGIPLEEFFRAPIEEVVR